MLPLLGCYDCAIQLQIWCGMNIFNLEIRLCRFAACTPESVPVGVVGSSKGLGKSFTSFCIHIVHNAPCLMLVTLVLLTQGSFHHQSVGRIWPQGQPLRHVWRGRWQSEYRCGFLTLHSKGFRWVQKSGPMTRLST